MSQTSLQYMRAHDRLNAEMPLRQYFLFVGGALLMLLIAANWLIPRSRSNELIDTKLPEIRIHSELKGPEAVVIDTSKSVIGPILTAHEDTVTPQTVIPSEWTPNEALVELDAPVRPQIGADGQKERGEGQHQIGRKVTGARLKRRPILIQRPDQVHVEPDATDFRESFAQLVARVPRQAGRNEPKARRPISVFDQGW
jgi:hypothetical protein